MEDMDMRTNSKLGFCECGGIIYPVWYYDEKDKKTYLSHGCCETCFKNKIVEQITIEEYRSMKK